MDDELTGRLLAGRYRVGASIGSGAMSVVYEAHDLRLSRQVALKFIRGTHSAERSERLFREAKAAARANHPAVITVYGYGTDDDTGLDYLVMERLVGEDLATRLAAQQRLPSELVVRLGIELADAVAHVHDAGVVHRDLKPANVFLAHRGLRRDELKLLDFGVAHQLDLHTLTITGEVVGTLAYMAPEQLLGVKRADPSFDIYALGVIFYELLSGSLPGQAASLADVAQRAGDPSDTDLIPLQPYAAPALIEIIGSCLQNDARRRLATARNLCDALQALEPHGRK
jgi:serine/threonine protein kinase